MPVLSSNHNLFGYVSSESTNKFIHIIAAKTEESLVGVVGKMLFFDTTIDGEVFRAIGTATSIVTRNTILTQKFSTIIAKGNSAASQHHQSDTRELTFIIQAVFRQTPDGWEQQGAFLDTSPVTSTPVHLLDEETIRELTAGSDTAYIGYFRGLDTPFPINTPDFGGKRGAYHSGVVGKSGSGKDLALTTPILTAQGWKTMGSLRVGDIVFNERYEWVPVTHVHDVITDSECFRVEFSDGSSLVAGSGHLWTLLTKETERLVLTDDEVQEIYETLAGFDLRFGRECPVVVASETLLIRNLPVSAQVSNDYRSFVEFSRVSDGFDAKLFLNAVAHNATGKETEGGFLRVWTTQELLAGLRAGVEFALPEVEGLTWPQQVVRYEAIEPEVAYKRGEAIACTNLMNNIAENAVDGALMAEALRYGSLTADDLLRPLETRSELLSGLLGQQSGSSDYRTKSREHAELVHALIFSTGAEARTISVSADTFVVKHLQSPRTVRTVKSVTPVETVDTRCITVGGDSALYLAGYSLIPTHNTAGYSFTLSTYMRHEQHALIIVDPQGQWANENGFVFSPQQFAQALGREVKILRIAEQVRLPASEELLSRLISQTNAWSRFRRMGKENAELFSDEVASLILRRDLDGDAKALLTAVFTAIATSPRTLNRIYADDKRRDAFHDELCLLCDLPLTENPEDEEPLSKKEQEDIEDTWASILRVFRPLLNLFSSKNLDGETRRPLSGNAGFLTDILQVRSEFSAPAPYVVIDMSPDVRAHAKSALNIADDDLAMKTLLDNSSIKALILQVLFTEIKKSSEVAFAKSGGNLNTQIIFDEAWRYAPENSNDPIIAELSNMLEGFAFDTRKFGVGWTYILQLPTELKKGIWSQLSYVYAMQGLTGSDLKLLEERYSDDSQTEIYKGFIPPAATQVYPLMIIGSISPLIFTTAPSFLNIFTSGEEFLSANREWIDGITTSRGLPPVTNARVAPVSNHDKKKVTKNKEVRNYKVGKTYESSVPQTAGTVKPDTVSKPAIDDDDLGSPF